MVPYIEIPLQNPTLGFLTARGWGGRVKSLDSKQGPGPQKPRCEIMCQGLHGTAVMTALSVMIPLGHWAALCYMNAFHLCESLQVVNFVPQFSWNDNGTQE
jgi:hypothetical protein